MGADGGMYYYQNSSDNSFLNQVLERLIEWLCSEQCSLDFAGSLYQKNNLIYIETETDAIHDVAETGTGEDLPNDSLESQELPNTNTEIFLSMDQLKFINMIYDHIVDFCHINQEYHENMMTYNQLIERRDTDYKFIFREDIDDLFAIALALDDAWDSANGMWFYWDTDSYHYSEPFEGNTKIIKKIYLACIDNEKFSQIFTNFDQFKDFIKSLPAPDYIEVWT